MVVAAAKADDAIPLLKKAEPLTVLEEFISNVNTVLLVIDNTL